MIRSLSFVSGIVVVLGGTATVTAADDPTLVFTSDEVKKCTRIRTPSLMLNTKTGMAHVVARCCGANQCSSKGLIAPGSHRLGDNDKDAKVVMKSSDDGGNSWKNFQILSPGPFTGYAGGAGMFDRQTEKLVVQYNYIPRGSTKPVFNASTYQIMSDDDGKTWSKPYDITSFLAPCNPDISDTQVGSAGSKTQTPSGRLVWTGHDHSSNVCVWYSDDNGGTYKTAKRLRGNEISFAATNSSGTTLYMNGRTGPNPWAPYRTDYWSYDDGTTWTAGSKSQLVEDSSGGCERSVAMLNNVLYSMEPQDDGRTKMVMSCSRDQGKTWPSSKTVNGKTRGGYSDMVGLASGKILAVWEDGSHPLDNSDPVDPDSGNFFAAQIDTDWC